MILLFPSVVPQTTVILNSDRQNAVVAKMEDPLSGRAPDPLENIISKSVARHPTSHRHCRGPGDRAASWGARVVGPGVLRGQGLGRTARPVSTAACAGGRCPVCSPRSANPVLSPHSHLSVCLSVCPSMSGRRRPLWLAKWWRCFEVVPFPLLFLWRRFACILGQRRECVEGTVTARVLAPRRRRPHRAASRRVSQALLQPVPLLPGCSPGSPGPQTPRSPAVDAPGRGRGPAEQQRVRVPRAHEGGVVARSGAFSEVQPPGWSPPGFASASRDLALLPLPHARQRLKGSRKGHSEGGSVSPGNGALFGAGGCSGFLAASYCSVSGSPVVVRLSPRKSSTGFFNPLEWFLSVG